MKQPAFEQVGTVTELVHYAGKSFAPSTYNGEPVTECVVGPTGLVCDGVPDRAMVAARVLDPESRTAGYLSLRGLDREGRARYPGHAALAFLQPDITGPGQVSIRVPGFQDLAVDLNDPKHTDKWDVRVHSSIYPALDLGDDVAAVATAYLRGTGKGDAPNEDIRLFGPDPTKTRRVRDEYLNGCATNELAGADGTALLLVNRNTLASGADVERARANIIVDMDENLEDFVEVVRIGEQGIGFEAVVAGACKRCTETGVNPRTGERDNIFMRQMAPSRTGETDIFGNGVYYGIGLNPILNGRQPVVRVGDPIYARLASTPNVKLRIRE